MNNDAKLRPLYLAKILYERTDEGHTLTTNQLIDILESKYIIASHRQTIKTDIELLKSFGLEIEEIRSTQNKYYLAARKFDIPELRMLIDAVESSRFITSKKSKALVSKIESLTSTHLAEALVRNIDVENRIKPGNEQIYYIVDTLNEAINDGKKVSFYYYHYNIRKQKCLKNDGKPYILSPYRLVWNGDYYYVVGFSDKHNKIGVFRVDRIDKDPTILDEAAHEPPADFDMNHYLNTMFRMYSVERQEVDLICSNTVIDAIIDRFGTDVQILAYDMENFRIITDVAVSHVFYSWIFGFGGKVKIKGPENVKENYSQMVKNAFSALD